MSVISVFTSSDTVPKRALRLDALSELRPALTRLMEQDSRREVEVVFSPGFHEVEEPLVLGMKQLPAHGYGCRLRSEHPERPAVLRASAAVRGWRPVEGTPLLQAALPEEIPAPRSLYVDGIRMPNARSRVFLPHTVEGRDPLRVCRVPREVLRGAPAENLVLSLLPKQKWIHNRIPLRSSDSETGEVELTVPATYDLDPIGYGWFPEGHAWIENHPQDLTEPGQWTMDYVSRTVTWWPLPDVDPEASVRVPVCTEMIRVEGEVDVDGPVDHCVQGVCIQDLHFTENDVYLWPEDHEGLGIQHDWEMWDAPSAALRFRGANECGVVGCTFTQLASTAVRLDLSCKRTQILRNRIQHVGVVGILASGYGPGRKDTNRHHLIEDNDISYVGESLWHGVGIFLWQSGHNVVRQNRISHCPYTGIVIAGRISYTREGKGQCSRTIRWEEIDVEEGAEKDWMTWFAREPYQHARENLVEGNDISRVMEMIGDGNAIYLSGAGGGNRIVGNFLHNNDSLCMNAVIRSDDDQHETVIADNVILRSVGEGILVKGISEICGNVIADLRAADSQGRKTDYLRGYLVFTTGAANGSVVLNNTCLFTQTHTPHMMLGRGNGRYGAVRKESMRMEGNVLLPWSQAALVEVCGNEEIKKRMSITPSTGHAPFWPRIRIKEVESRIRADE